VTAASTHDALSHAQASARSARPRLDLAAVRRFHIYTDVLLVAAAWLGAYSTRLLLNSALGYPINEAATYEAALPLIVPPWIASCWLFGIYQTTRLKTVVEQIQELLKGVLLGLLVISSLAFFFRELEVGRLVVLLTAAYSLVLQGASRAAFYRIERRLQSSGRYHVPTLIMGAGTFGIRLLQKIQEKPELGHRVVGFLDDDPEALGGEIASCPVLGRVADVRRIVEEYGVSEVFVAMPRLGHTNMLSLVLDCEDLGVTFRVVTDLFEVLTAGTSVDLVDDLPLVRLGGRQPGPHYIPAKRAIDIVAALVGLLLSAPFWLYWALRIKLESKGPVFFVHERVGKDGKTFRMWKFRTMGADCEPYSRAPEEHTDARVTRYGRWLRRSSIDEVPQLLNVLRGDMSLVGPRPEMPFIVDSYDEWQRRRLSVKPGITGLWQILGRKDLPMHENLHYDFYYIRNRSLWLDLSLMIRTVWAVLSRRGAY
jgi:exopolysaccharide biosynthesis polyprenyl glycosylphosphotransferase